MILHVFNSSLVSGPETLVIPSLPKLPERAEVAFLSETRCGERSSQPPAYARSFGVTSHELRVRSRWDKRAIRDLAALIDQLKPRLIHAHEVKASAYVAAAVRVASHRPRLVTTNHGVRGKRTPVLRAYEWFYTRWVMPRFDQVLCVCSSDRELLRTRGVPAEKLQTHLNGTDRPKVPASARREKLLAARKAWGMETRGVPKDALILGVVGRLAIEKRYDLILETFAQVLKLGSHLPPCHLVIFGTGTLEHELKKRTKELGIEHRVHWMGYRGSVGTEMAGFDVLLSLSSAEGLPINVVEAGWAGTCAAVTAVDGNRDLIPSEEFGLLLAPEAKASTLARRLTTLLSDATARNAKGLALQKRVEETFSGTRWRTRLVEIYAPHPSHDPTAIRL